MYGILKTLLTAVALTVWAGTPVEAETPLQSQETAAENQGWEAVGRLNFGREGFCTAALITSDVVLTAAHCLFDPQTGGRIDAS